LIKQASSSTANGAKVDVFVEQWVSVVCGMTAHGMCSRFEIFESAHHIRFEIESGRPIRIRIESRSFAGPTFRCWKWKPEQQTSNETKKTSS